MNSNTLGKSYKKQNGTLGAEAIDRELSNLFGVGKPFAQFPMKVGDDIKSHAVSVYVESGHLLYISRDLFSRWGFELTFRLKLDSEIELPEHVPSWPVSVIRGLYKYVRSSGRIFKPNQAIPLTDRPICSNLGLRQSVITGLGFVEDPLLKNMEKSGQSMQFILAVGLTQSECSEIKEDHHKVLKILKVMGMLDPLYQTDVRRGLYF